MTPVHEDLRGFSTGARVTNRAFVDNPRVWERSLLARVLWIT